MSTTFAQIPAATSSITTPQPPGSLSWHQRAGGGFTMSKNLKRINAAAIR